MPQRLWPGSARKPAGVIACRQKRNGNMRRARGPPKQDSGAATMVMHVSLPMWRIPHAARQAMRDSAKNSIAVMARFTPTQSAAIAQTRLGCTTYLAVCGSGLKTVGMTVTRVRRRMGPLGRVAIVESAWRAAAVGTLNRLTCARPTAPGLAALTATLAAGFGLPRTYNPLTFTLLPLAAGVSPPPR